MTIKTYSELSTLYTFKERYEYLRLSGSIGKDTFGFDRYLNQIFYKTIEWRSLRDQIIVRDNGCDLGIVGHEIDRSVSIYIHHMNPISKDDILNRSELLFNPDYLITTILSTHNAIHFSDESFLNRYIITERTRNDTCPWKR